LGIVIAADSAIGSQLNDGLMTFTIGANGIISSKAITAATSSRWTMNENKIMTNVSVGY
jgi:hypothetical protein